MPTGEIKYLDAYFSKGTNIQYKLETEFELYRTLFVIRSKIKIDKIERDINLSVTSNFKELFIVLVLLMSIHLK